MVPIIIPAYEPDDRMIKLLKELKEARLFPVIIINDGSGEAYNEIFVKAERIIAEDGGILLKHEVNRGKGRALKTGFSYVLANMPEAIGAVTADSDGQHTTGCIEAVRAALGQEPDHLVLGVRNFDGEDVPWKSRFGNKLTMKVLGYIGGIRISDTQTGLRGIPRSFMKELLDVRGERFEFETRMLLESADKYPIREVTIETVYDSRENHQTHFDPVKDSIRIYKIFGVKFLKYIFASGSSCVLDLGLFALFCRLLKSGNPTSYVIMATVFARIISAIYNYAINYKLVFKSREHAGKAAVKYFCLAALQMSCSAFLVDGATKLLPGVAEVIVKAVIDTLLFFVSYHIQQKYVFRSTKKKAGEKA